MKRNYLLIYADNGQIVYATTEWHQSLVELEIQGSSLIYQEPTAT